MYDALKEGFESINIPINTGMDTEIMDRILTLLRHQKIPTKNPEGNGPRSLF